MIAFWQTCLFELRHLLGVKPDEQVAWLTELQPIAWNACKGELSIAADSAKTPFIRARFLSIIEKAVERANNGRPVSVTIVPVEVQSRPRFEKLCTYFGQEWQKGSELAPELSFERYICGSSNHLAIAAAEHVAQTTGSQYNPLLICGEVGLGKTHLLQAIGQRYLDLHPKAKVRYILAKELISHLLSGEVKSKRTSDAFIAELVAADLLLIDDAEHLAQSHDLLLSQREILSTIAQKEKGHQLVLASRVDLRSIEIAPELIDFISHGLTVLISRPDLTMRTSILLAKSREMNLALPEETAAFIAKRLSSNIRELEGSLQLLAAQLRYSFEEFSPHTPISIEVAKNALRDVFLLEENIVTIELIQQTISDYFKIPLADLKSRKKNRRLTLIRQIAMYLAEVLTPLSLPEIGFRFGGRSHKTVMLSVRKITAKRRVDDAFDHEIYVIEQMLRG